MGATSIWQIFRMSGFVIWILIFCSVLSLAVIAQRILLYRSKSAVKRHDFMEVIRAGMSGMNADIAVAHCDRTDAPFSAVVKAGLAARGGSETSIQNAMERQITIEISQLERHLNILGTIGSTAVYIGLLGTVLGIIRAFQDIATSGGGNISTVIGGISEALFSTAAGIVVAVPAVIMYNYFLKRIEDFTTDMELCRSEIMDILRDMKA